MTAPNDERFQFNFGFTIADEQGADTLRSVKLVRGECGQVEAQLSNINGNLADRLGEVRKKRRPGTMCRPRPVSSMG